MWLRIGIVLGLAVGSAGAQTELQKALNDLELRGHWIYDDVGAGFAAAKKSHTGRYLKRALG